LEYIEKEYFRNFADISHLFIFIHLKKCEQMWTTTEFVVFQKYFFGVLIPIIIVVGNLESILNIIVFSVSKNFDQVHVHFI